MQYRAVLCMAIACVSAIGLAQEKPSLADQTVSTKVKRRVKPITPVASLRLDVNRVLIPVTVTDAEDHKVQGLRKEDFRLLEDGIPREVTDFFIDESPVSVAIVLDSSNSMRPKFDNARRAIAEFMRMSHPDDEFSLITVKDHPELMHGFTMDTKSILHQVEHVLPQGWTALNDGMYLGINQLRRANRERRVLFVMSDGGDNNSRYTESEIRRLILESDVRIFTISILERSPAIEKFADQSGGRAFRVKKLDELPERAAALSDLVHGEYVLGFTPGDERRDGKHHTIKVELNQPGNRLHATWRHGYAAPLQ